MTTTLSDLAETAAENPTRRNWLWYISQCIVGVFFGIWLGFRARGTEKIPATGGGLVVINHQSFIDPMVVGLPLRRPISFLARDSLFRVPVLGWILRNTYVKPISREAASSATIRGTIARMEQGFLCGIFPEGTRSPDGTLGEFKPGFVALVRRGNMPIYPVGVAGANKALGRGSWFLKPRRVRVVFGEPIDAETVKKLSQKGREQELVSLVRERVAACRDEAEAWRKG